MRKKNGDHKHYVRARQRDGNFGDAGARVAKSNVADSDAGDGGESDDGEARKKQSDHRAVEPLDDSQTLSFGAKRGIPITQKEVR